MASAVVKGDDEVMGKLQLVFGTRGPIGQGGTSSASGRERVSRYRDFVRRQMTQNAFYDNVLPKLFMLIDKPFDADASRFVLQRGDIGGKDTYFLHAKCAAADVVSVKPWWDTKAPVRICKDDYRPTVMTEANANGRPTFCEAPEAFVAGERKCGCGPYLLNCSRDEQQNDALLRTYRDEVVRTIQFVVQSKRPFSDILTMNETVRSDLGDFFYARANFYLHGTFDYPPPVLDAPARPRPRPPMFAGLMTTPQYRLWNSAPRLIVSIDWDEFLCTTHNAARVDAHTLMEAAKNPTLRLQDHMELTTIVGCRDCHARLEYGMRVFRNFPTVRYGLRYAESPGSATESTKFYVNNSADLRAEGTADPRWLGQVMTKQPEFFGCMARKVEESFFPEQPISPILHRRILDDFVASQDAGKLIEDVIVARFVGEEAFVAERSP